MQSLRGEPVSALNSLTSLGEAFEVKSLFMMRLLPLWLKEGVYLLKAKVELKSISKAYIKL